MRIKISRAEGRKLRLEEKNEARKGRNKSKIGKGTIEKRERTAIMRNIGITKLNMAERGGNESYI